MRDMSFMDKLLDGVAVEWKALGEVCRFINGRAYIQNTMDRRPTGKHPER